MARFLDNAKNIEISYKPTDTSLSLENERFDVVSTSGSVVDIGNNVVSSDASEVVDLNDFADTTAKTVTSAATNVNNEVANVDFSNNNANNVNANTNSQFVGPMPQQPEYANNGGAQGANMPGQPSLVNNNSLGNGATPSNPSGQPSFNGPNNQGLGGSNSGFGSNNNIGIQNTAGMAGPVVSGGPSAPGIANNSGMSYVTQGADVRNAINDSIPEVGETLKEVANTSYQNTADSIQTTLRVEDYDPEIQEGIEALRATGLLDSDIQRLLNGEITLDELLLEIENDTDTYRKRRLYEAGFLASYAENEELKDLELDKFHSLDELVKHIKELERQKEELITEKNMASCNTSGSFLLFMDEAWDGDSVDRCAKLHIAYWKYTDEDGNVSILYENPISDGKNIESRKYEGVSYYEAFYGDKSQMTEEELKFREKYKSEYEELKKKIDSKADLSDLKNKYQKESDERKKKIAELEKQIEDVYGQIQQYNAINESINISINHQIENVDPYIYNDDYEENCEFDESCRDVFKKYEEKAKAAQANQIPDHGMQHAVVYADNEDVAALIACEFNGESIETNVKFNSEDDRLEHWRKWNRQTTTQEIDGKETEVPIISEQDKKTYLYIYNTKGADAALAYLDSLATTVDYNWLNAKRAEDAKFAQEHEVLASVGSIFITPFEGMAAAYNSSGTIIGKMLGKDADAKIYRTDVYSSGITWRSAVSQEIMNYGQGGHTNLAMLYDASMSMGDSATFLAMNYVTMGTITPFLSAAWMGSRAYVSTLNDGLDKGLSDGQAVALAWGATAIETVMESYSAGHLMNLDKSLDLVAENLSKRVAKLFTKPEVQLAAEKLTYIVAGSVSQGIAEGEEELGTEIVNYWWDQIVSKDKSDFAQSMEHYLALGYTQERAEQATALELYDRMKQAFVGGLISGIGFGGFSSSRTVRSITKRIAADTSNQYQGNTEAEKFTDVLTQDRIAREEQEAKERSERLAKAKNLVAYIKKMSDIVRGKQGSLGINRNSPAYNNQSVNVGVAAVTTQVEPNTTNTNTNNKNSYVESDKQNRNNSNRESTQEKTNVKDNNTDDTKDATTENSADEKIVDEPINESLPENTEEHKLEESQTDSEFKIVIDPKIFDQILSIQSIKEDQLPKNYSSVDAYKIDYLHQLMKTEGFEKYIEPLTINLVKDSTMFHEILTNTEIIDDLFVKYILSSPVGPRLICNMFFNAEDVNYFFSKPIVKKYVSGLSAQDLGKLAGLFQNNISFEAIGLDTFADEICNFDLDEIDEFLTAKGKYYVTNRVNNSEEYNKICEHVLQELSDDNNISKFGIVSRLISDYNAKSYMNLINREFSIKRDLVSKVNTEIDDNLEKTDYGDVIYNNISKKEYIDVNYEIDGVPYVAEIRNTSLNRISLGLNLLYKEEIAQAIIDGKFKIKSIIPSRKNDMVLDTTVLSPGLNYVTCSVDGQTETIALSINNNETVDFNEYFPNAKDISIEKIDKIGEVNIEVDESKKASTYRVDYTLNGKNEFFYVTPKYSKYSSDYKLNISNYVVKNKLIGAKDFSVSESNASLKEEMANTHFDEYNDVFNEAEYGGTQSYIREYIYKYYDGTLDTNSIEYQKATAMIKLMKRYYPDITDNSIMRLADLCSTSGCGYMADSNIIIAYFGKNVNGSKFFSHTFGYDFSYSDGKKTSYNYETLALDIFLNQMKNEYDNSTDLIYDLLNGGMDAGFNMNMPTMIEDVLEDFLQKHGINCSYRVSDKFTPQEYNIADSYLASLASNPNSYHILSSSNAKVIEANVKMGQIKGIADHQMVITDVGENGNLFTSSWGKKYKFLPDRLDDNFQGRLISITLDYPLLTNFTNMLVKNGLSVNNTAAIREYELRGDKILVYGNIRYSKETNMIQKSSFGANYKPLTPTSGVTTGGMLSSFDGVFNDEEINIESGTDYINAKLGDVSEAYSLLDSKLNGVDRNDIVSLSQKVLETIHEYFGGIDNIDQRLDYYEEGIEQIENNKISNLKGTGAAMCVERAVLAQNLLKYLGIDSICKSSAIVKNGNNEAHDYNLISFDGKYYIFDSTMPNIVNDVPNPLIAEIDEDTFKQMGAPLPQIGKSVTVSHYNPYRKANITVTYDSGRQNSIEVNPISNQDNEELEAKNEFKELSELRNRINTLFNLSMSDTMDKNISDALINAISNSSKITNPNVREIMENLIDIFEENNIRIATTPEGTMFWHPFKAVLLNFGVASNYEDCFMNLFHENGHAVFHISDGSGDSLEISLTDDEIKILQNARDNYQLTDERKRIFRESMEKVAEAHKKTDQWYEPFIERENEKIQNAVEQMLLNNETEKLKAEIKNVVTYNEVKKIFLENEIELDDYDRVIGNKELLIRVLQTGNHINNKLAHDDILFSDYNQYGKHRKISSMLNSLLMSKNPIDLGNNTSFEFYYCHEDSYFAERGEVSSFDELMADYFSICASGNQEIIDDIEIVLGKDVVELLNSKYKSIADNLIRKTRQSSIASTINSELRLDEKASSEMDFNLGRIFGRKDRINKVSEELKTTNSDTTSSERLSEKKSNPDVSKYFYKVTDDSKKVSTPEHLNDNESNLDVSKYFYKVSDDPKEVSTPEHLNDNESNSDVDKHFNTVTDVDKSNENAEWLKTVKTSKQFIKELFNRNGKTTNSDRDRAFVRDVLKVIKSGEFSSGASLMRRVNTVPEDTNIDYEYIIENTFNDQSSGYIISGVEDITELLPENWKNYRGKYDYRITLRNSDRVNPQNAVDFINALIEEANKREINLRMKNMWEGEDAIILYCQEDDLLKTVQILEDFKDPNKYGESVANMTKSFGNTMPFAATVGKDGYYGISMHSSEDCNPQFTMQEGTASNTFNDYMDSLINATYNKLFDKYNGNIDKISYREFYAQMCQIHTDYMGGSKNGETIPLWMNYRLYNQLNGTFDENATPFWVLRKNNRMRNNKQRKSIEDVHLLDSHSNQTADLNSEPILIENPEQMINMTLDDIENIQDIADKNVQYLLHNMRRILKALNININTNGKRTQYSSSENTIFIDSEHLTGKNVSVPSLTHESGHGMHIISDGSKIRLTDEQIVTLNYARKQFTKEQEQVLEKYQKLTDEINKKAEDYYKTMESTEEEKIESLVDVIFETNSQEQYRNQIQEASNYAEIHKYLTDLDIDTEDIDGILYDKDLLTKVLQMQNKILIKTNYRGDLLYTDEYKAVRIISSMYNALLTSDDSIKLSNGSEYEFCSSHDNKYFHNAARSHRDKNYSNKQSFAELMAYYIELQALHSDETIEDMRMLLGDDVMDMLAYKYNEIAQNIGSILLDIKMGKNPKLNISYDNDMYYQDETISSSTSTSISPNSTPQEIANKYIENLEHYASKGITYEDLLFDLTGEKVINAKTRAETGEIFGDSRIEMFSILNRALESFKVSKSTAKYVGEQVSNALNGPLEKFNIETIRREVKKLFPSDVEMFDKYWDIFRYTIRCKDSIDSREMFKSLEEYMTEEEKVRISSIIESGEERVTKMINSVTDDQHNSLYVYTKEGSGVFNGKLVDDPTYNGRDTYRAHGISPEEMIRKAYDKALGESVDVGENYKALSDLINNNKFDKTIKVYRYVKDFGKKRKRKDLKVGAKFVNKGFTSSTTSLEDYLSMFPSTSGVDIMLEIIVPAGSRAAYIEPLSGVPEYFQNEFLIGEDSTLTIIEDAEDVDFGKKRVRVVKCLLTQEVSNAE